MQLEGYALALVQGVWFIGKHGASPSGDYLEPAYEAHVRWMGDGNGNFGVLREATPIQGSTTIRLVYLPAGAVVFQCSAMSGRERESWANAIRECEGLIQALKTAESGLVLPPAPGNIIK